MMNLGFNNITNIIVEGREVVLRKLSARKDYGGFYACQQKPASLATKLFVHPM